MDFNQILGKMGQALGKTSSEVEQMLCKVAKAVSFKTSSDQAIGIRERIHRDLAKEHQKLGELVVFHLKKNSAFNDSKLQASVSVIDGLNNRINELDRVEREIKETKQRVSNLEKSLDKVGDIKGLVKAPASVEKEQKSFSTVEVKEMPKSQESMFATPVIPSSVSGKKDQEKNQPPVNQKVTSQEKTDGKGSSGAESSKPPQGKSGTAPTKTGGNNNNNNSNSNNNNSQGQGKAKKKKEKGQN